MASQIADQRVWQQQRRADQNRPHPLNIQTLSIELDERKKARHERRARVYQFNYNTQRSRLLLVDLDNQSIIKEQEILSIHLPLNNQEIASARNLIEQSPGLMQRLSEAQQNRGRAQLNDLSQLDVKASVFEPDNPEHVCASQRCALISLFDQTRTVFAIEPVINLQQLTVSTLQQDL